MVELASTHKRIEHQTTSKKFVHEANQGVCHPPTIYQVITKHNHISYENGDYEPAIFLGPLNSSEIHIPIF